MPYFLAVDAGGTKTEFALADQERELLRVRTGAIQHPAYRTMAGTRLAATDP